MRWLLFVQTCCVTDLYISGSLMTSGSLCVQAYILDRVFRGFEGERSTPGNFFFTRLLLASRFTSSAARQFGQIIAIIFPFHLRSYISRKRLGDCVFVRFIDLVVNSSRT